MNVKLLTETELKELAQELSMPLEQIKSLYEKGIAGGNILGFKEFKEVALKANGGGANAATDDEGEEEDEGDKANYSKKEMKTILESLSVAEFKELQNLIEEVKVKASDEDDEEEEEEEMPMKVKKEAKRLDKLENLVSQQGEMLLQQTKAMSELANAIVGKQNQDTLNTAVGNFLSQAPRQEAARFVSTSVKSNDNIGEKDAEILKALKALEDKVTQLPGGKKDVYDAFTSQRLNQR